MNKYSVVLERFIDEEEGTMQYVAEVQANHELEAIPVAIRELVAADKKDKINTKAQNVKVCWVFAGWPKVLIAEGTTCAENPFRSRK